VPTTVAACWLPSASVTVIAPVAPATTWLLVSTSPSAVRMTPLPSEVPWASRTWMSTVLGSTAAAAPATVPAAAAVGPVDGATVSWPVPVWSSSA
jgi:hypothetical protein